MQVSGELPIGSDSGISLAKGLGSLWTPCWVTALSFLHLFIPSFTQA